MTPRCVVAWLRGLSLRRRLLALLLALTAVVLAAAGAVTSSSLQTFLLDRTDQQLGQLVDATGSALSRGDIDARRVGTLPAGAIRLLISPDGTRALALPNPYVTAAPTPAVDQTAAQRLAEEPPDGHPRTLGELSGVSGRYRVESTTLPGGTTLVLGLPLATLDATAHRLMLLETAVGLIALLVVGVAGSALIRVALHPLASITATTRRIAATDLSGLDAAVQLRVPELSIDTEVGQLGQGMNHMLGAIDAAFIARNEADRRLRQFVADASHELRTPLTTIRGYAELFDRPPTGDLAELEEAGTAMRRIEEESRRMALLVDDLLLLARLDQGRPLERVDVDLTRLAVDAATDFRVTDRTRPIHLDVPAEPVVVPGDEPRLRQVVANLLANTHAHTPEGTTVAVRVSAHERAAVLEVHDTGPGIPASAREHVFDRFFRADPSRARGSGGTGLGLAIVRAIVTAHQGEVSVASEPGSTTLRVSLPVQGARAPGPGVTG